MKKLLISMLLTSCYIICSTAAVFAAVGTDQLTDGAVTTSKLADGAVTTEKIADNAVTDAKISGTISGSKLGAHIHSGTDISDATITDAKISGQISASKISSNGLNADTVDGRHASDLADAIHTHAQTDVTGLAAALDGKSDANHNHDALYQQKFGKVAVVAQTGGDYTHPMAAAAAVASWCGTPSLTNRCLIKIMPGIYDFDRNGIEIPDYVDIAGSGQNVTKLLNTTVFVYYHSELRDLTIENNNGFNTSGIWLVTRQFVTGGPDKITNVTINISNMTDPQYAGYGMVIQSVGDYILKDVTINLASTPAPTYGITTAFSHGKMSGVTVNTPSALTGILLQYGSTAKINYSTISAAQSVVADNSTAHIASANISGASPSAVNGGVVKCFGLFNDNYDPIACQ